MTHPDDLAGELTIRVSDQHADFLLRNLSALLIEQDLRPVARRPYAVWQALPARAMADQALVDCAVDRLLDRLRPWTRPDDIELSVTLFPRLERLARFGRATRGKLRWVAVWFASQRRKDGR